MFVVYEQLVGSFCRHVFSSRNQFSNWMKLNPGSKMVPAKQAHGRCLPGYDHTNDFDLEFPDEEDPMYQQPLFVDVHKVKEEAQTSQEVQAPPSTLILPGDLDRVYEEYKESCSEALLRRFNGRLERALLLAKEGKVRVGPIEGEYIVCSQKAKGATYLVDIKAKTCNCPDANAGNVCKHRMAAWLIDQVVFRGPVQEPTTPAEEIAASIKRIHNQLDKDNADAALDHVFSKLVFHRSCPRVVWGMLDYEGSKIPIEIQEYNGERVFVQALPSFIDGKFVPSFPFEDEFGNGVPYSTTWVSKDQLSSIKVFGGDNA